MNFKSNTIVIFNTSIQRMLEAWKEACKEILPLTYEPTVTSGIDGSHSLESGHYYGRSLDFRSRDIPFELREVLKKKAQTILGPTYLVLLESSHYHIQRNKHDM